MSLVRSYVWRVGIDKSLIAIPTLDDFVRRVLFDLRVAQAFGYYFLKTGDPVFEGFYTLGTFTETPASHLVCKSLIGYYVECPRPCNGSILK